MCHGCSCPHRPGLAISFLLSISTQVHCHISCLAWLAFPVGESSEKTPSAEVSRAFHSDAGVEAALNLLVTGLTHTLSPGSFPPYTGHTGRALVPARTSDPLGMQTFPQCSWCYTMNVGKWLECFGFAWSFMYGVSFLLSLNFWSISKEISAQPIIQEISSYSPDTQVFCSHANAQPFLNQK